MTITLFLFEVFFDSFIEENDLQLAVYSFIYTLGLPAVVCDLSLILKGLAELSPPGTRREFRIAQPSGYRG